MGSRCRKRDVNRSAAKADYFNIAFAAFTLQRRLYPRKAFGYFGCGEPGTGAKCRDLRPNDFLIAMLQAAPIRCTHFAFFRRFAATAIFSALPLPPQQRCGRGGQALLPVSESPD